MNLSYTAALGQGIAGVLSWIVQIVWYVACIVACWRVFAKAGVPGWKALIPFYNLYVEYGLTWKANMAFIVIALQLVSPILSNTGNGILTLIGFAGAIAGLVLSIIGQNKLARSFGHGVGFTVGLVLLEPVFLMILGFGSSEYIGNTTTQA